MMKVSNAPIRYEIAHGFRRAAGYFQARICLLGFYMMIIEEYEFDNTNRLHL